MSETPAPSVVVTIPDPPPEGKLRTAAEPLHQMLVLNAPVRLWERASEHTADLMREFALLRIGRDSGTTRHHVPEALLKLVADLRARYAGISSAQEAEFQAAVDGGQRSHDFTYHVPAAAADACRGLLELLDAADDYCAEGTELITQASPPDQRDFRHWYLLEFARQIGGELPRPWPGSLD